VDRDLRPGRVGLFSGKVSAFRGVRQLTHPDYRLLPDTADGGLDGVDPTQVLSYAGTLVPVYPATQALQSWVIADAVGLVLPQLPADLDDPLPEALRAEHGLMGLREALLAVHIPRTLADAEAAQDRLRWDEAFVLQAVLAQRRRAASALPATPRVDPGDAIRAAFDARLPFRLTAGQEQVGHEIEHDLAQGHPTHRPPQGAVGSGKTVVALRAMLAVVDTGGQAVLLAPTEVLAQQHHRSITALLGELAERGRLGGTDIGTRVALVTGSMTAAQRREALLDIGVGDAGIVVGTHALLEERVQFFDLGLVVVDEQHRFGVEQRAALTAKSRDGTRPHVLVMTATPIPRTVAMTVFGDLETSTLTELPAGRAPIATHVVSASRSPHFLDRAWERIREEVAEGRQAYVVCPRIDAADVPVGMEHRGPEDRPVRPGVGVLEIAPMLTGGPLAGLRLATLHGRMPSEEKDAVMRAFAAGEVDVLVATTVIEVGVDVPNATVMVVMDAEWFGVSQLHQIRGRIGRGGHPGLCLLVTDHPPGTLAWDRLGAVAGSLDGFELSRIDLEQRREGDVLGVEQSGSKSSLRLLQVLVHEELIAEARERATALVDVDPTLASLPALARAVAAVEDADRADFLDKS
jgi:ATP-dependent DNA helicase RecG